MKEDQAVKIEFPCDYPIRIVGFSAPDYKDFVVRVVTNHAPDFAGQVKMKTSSNGKYMSATVVIRATGEPQLKALFEEFKTSGRIQMVL